MDMLKIGLSQMDVCEGDIKGNCDKLERIIREHSGNGLDLLCFPELCISGYDYNVLARGLDEQEILSSLAEKYKIPILAGIAIHENGKNYDAVGIWDDNGTLLGTYRKIHLWGEESKYFAHGDSLEIVPFHGWNIGILLCADLGFPDLSTALALKNADLFICPSAWAIHYEELFILAARMRAAENQVYTIALNRGNNEDQRYCGNTVVCSPDGVIMLNLNNFGEDYAEVMLQQQMVAETRKNIPWLAMRLPEVYKKMRY